MDHDELSALLAEAKRTRSRAIELTLVEVAALLSEWHEAVK